MRRISVNKIKNIVSELCLEANTKCRGDIKRAMKKAFAQETNKRARNILGILLKNAEIAKIENRPLCQDTGIVSVYLDIGQDVLLTDGDLEKAVQKGVEDAYRKGFLRKSVVQSPILRKNTFTNTPSIIHTNIVKGSKVKITCVPKGFGSENKSGIKMLNPTDGREEILSFVLDVVKKAGPDACPPFILGIGLGGTMDKAASLAHEALTLPLDSRNPKRHLAQLEEAIFKKVNKLSIGPMGLGGKTTALGVKIIEYPTHIAGLPVAVCVGCHITRSASGVV